MIVVVIRSISVMFLDDDKIGVRRRYESEEVFFRKIKSEEKIERNLNGN